jgi:hypothetical protein
LLAIDPISTEVTVPEPGYIVVDGTPDFAVLIDGVPIGHAPFRYEISVGSHAVVLRNANGSSVERRVMVESQRAVRVAP